MMWDDHDPELILKRSIEMSDSNPKRKHRVFISLPMHNRTKDEVLDEIRHACVVYLAMTGKDVDDILFVHNLDADRFGKPADLKFVRVWYLGIALNALSNCDEAFFWRGWDDSFGCRIEHDVCVSYDIPYIAIETGGV